MIFNLIVKLKKNIYDSIERVCIEQTAYIDKANYNAMSDYLMCTFLEAVTILISRQPQRKLN